jgi:multidrug efflux pump subunit AcrA (membrane-fusion protein)
LKRLLRRRIVVAVAAVALLGGAGAWVFATRLSGASPVYRTTTATLATVTQTISLAGNLTPVGETDLDFGASGRVLTLNVQAGQTVTAGQVLATLDTASLQGALTQAQANLSSAQARLSLDQAGPTAQNLAQSRGQVSTAQVQLATARTNYNDTQAANQQSINQAQSAVTSATNQVNADCPSSPSCAADRQALQQDQNTLAAALVKSQQSIDQAQEQINSAQVGLNNAQASLSALQQSVTPQQIQMDQAQVAVAQVNVDSAQRALDQASLTAPAAGTVGQVNITPGQSVSSAAGNGSGSSSSSSSSSASTTHSIVILTPGAFAVTGTVSDAQVNQLAVGQRAQVTPAGSTQAMPGKVTLVAAQATLTSGVATFAVTVTLDDNQPSLRSGSSASVSVIINQVVHVLTVPTSAVTGGGTVQVLVNGQPQARTVQVGAADALRTQIVSGLNPGDLVVLATVSSTIPTTANGAGRGGFGLTGGGGGGGGGAGRGGGG